ncbi:MAG: hypothetical protein A2167_04745 [Planctomycetes bacterium RBG_13_46_10]|nr:MAG: hypothetical protein A2167_04745 [Planctomycetes bacterium RBG_13_46_10]
MNRHSHHIEICFIAPKAYPLFNPDIQEPFGGAELDLYFLATELAKDKDFAVSFITADYGQQDIEIIKGVAVIKSLDFKKNALIGAVKVWRALRRADAAMYMIKTISPGMFLTALFCRLKGRIFLYRTSNTNSCDGSYLKQHHLLGRIYKWALRSAKQVFVQNRTDIDNLLCTTGVLATAVQNAHCLDELRQSMRDTILWIGRSVEIKKPMLFIELAEKTPYEHFTMICQCATGDRNYDGLVARAERVKNLQFIQRVPFSEIDRFFQRAKVFVNTSDAEGFPNTFIQACEFGVPILSLNVNPDDFLYEYGCGISCRGSFEHLIDSLDFILAEDRYIEMGKRGRAYVEQNHDIKKIIEKYKKIFRQILGSTGSL